APPRPADGDRRLPLQIAGDEGLELAVIAIVHNMMVDSGGQENLNAVKAVCLEQTKNLLLQNPAGGAVVRALAEWAELVDVMDGKPSLLAAAALCGRRDAVEALLDDGAPVDGGGGLSALHAAAFKGHAHLIDVLDSERRAPAQVARGAATDARGGSTGRTPLHIAAALGDAPFVRRLLHAGANADADDHQGATPACLAALQGHLP
ncbi:Ankyrin repeat-containing protein, putative, partial [Gryllus bimaculatus]